MTPQEAKIVLLRFRGGNATVEDEELRAALKTTETNPELQTWLKQQEDFQKSVSQQLRSLPIPPDLKDQILTGRKILRSGWNRRRFLISAAAACFTLTSGILVWRRRSIEEKSFARFQSRMVGFALREYRMDIETSNPTKIRAYLRQKGAPSDFDLPEKLQSIPVKGGARVPWKGHSVAMMCFMWTPQETLYLFVIEQDHVKKLTAEKTPEISTFKGMTTATWKVDGKVCLLIGHPGREVFEQLLAQPG